MYFWLSVGRNSWHIIIFSLQISKMKTKFFRIGLTYKLMKSLKVVAHSVLFTRGTESSTQSFRSSFRRVEIFLIDFEVYSIEIQKCSKLFFLVYFLILTNF